MRTALIVGVDGVVSSVHPLTPTWGDEVVAGDVAGPVLVSPTLCRRLDALASLPDVVPAWLTSWNAEMRAEMDPWPGRGWPDLGNPWDAPRGTAWWKRRALETWLNTRPDITAIAWCDDDLRSAYRRAVIRSRFAGGGLKTLLLAPPTAEGLDRKSLNSLTAWLMAPIAETAMVTCERSRSTSTGSDPRKRPLPIRTPGELDAPHLHQANGETSRTK